MSAKFNVQNEDCRTDTSTDLKQKIIKYYDECFIDYRLFWLDSKNLAMHYGYWDEDTKTHSDSLLHMNRAVAKKLDIKPGSKILDAGCGIGGSSIWLASNFDVEVTGISLAASQIKKAEQYAKQKGVADRVTFRAADYTNTPFEDESFDIVWGLESICYAVQKKDFVQEAHRVLKPGGQIMVADGFAFKTDFTEEEGKYVQAFLDGCVVPNLATVEEFRKAMEGTGFKGIQYEDITAKVMRSSDVLHQKSIMTYPIEKILGWVGIRTSTQTGNYYAASHQNEIFKRGLAGYSIFSAMK